MEQYEAVSHGKKLDWLEQRHLDYPTICKWKKSWEERQAQPKRERLSLQRTRADGGGRKAMLPEAMERDIKEWIVQQRTGSFAHIVTVSQLLIKASSLSGKPLSDGWLWGFMARHRLSLRAVTTNKVSARPIMEAVMEEFRYRHRELLEDKTRLVNIVNMDETAIFFDMHHDRTIDFTGARTVQAHQTKNADDRVTVVVWVFASGEVGPPLIVHRKVPPQGECKTERGKAERRRIAQLKNRPRRLEVRIPVYNKDHEDEVVEDSELDVAGAHGHPIRPATARRRRQLRQARAAATEYRNVIIYTCHNDSGWMVDELMQAWIEHVFVPHTAPDVDGWRYLFMDNCGPHETDAVVASMRRLQVKEIMLPPNYSHLLQPLDFSLNASIKYVYRLEHAQWLLREIAQPTGPILAVEVSAKAGAVTCRRRKRKRKNADSDGETEPGPDSRSRAATVREIQTRVATAVYALTPEHVLKCWAHTLNGERLLRAAVAGHDQREQDGARVAIPLSRKRKKKDSEAADVPVEGKRRRTGEADDSQAADAEDDAQEDSATIEAVGDDLQIELELE